MTLNAHSCHCCQLRGCGLADLTLEGIVKMRPEITYNNNRFHPNGSKAPDGIEIRFGSTRPTPEVREMLKAHGFKFSEKQTMWYARDTSKARELAAHFESNDTDADDTQYEKRYLWANVGSAEFFEKLTKYTEFMVSGTPNRFFRTKPHLLSAIGNPSAAIYNGSLRFKKFYNKVVGEGEEETRDQPDDNEETDESDEAPKPETANPVLAERLNDMASSMQKQIDAKINSATSKQRPTPKRLRVAAEMRAEGYAMRNVQTFLYALAGGHRAGTIQEYPLLGKIKSRAQVELVNRYSDAFGKPHDEKYLHSTFEYNQDKFSAIGISSVSHWLEAIRQRDALISSQPSEFRPAIDVQAEKVRELEMKIKGMKIPGFFPTPAPLIDQLVAYAGITGGDEVLEPSAGKGDILDAISRLYDGKVALHACELNPTLRQMLILKEYDIAGTDFLELDRKFDRIVMNPPFENKQDIDHVMHAFSLLKPGGGLAAIMSEGSFNRSKQKDIAFREFLSDKNAFVSEPIHDAFKDAFNRTGITVRIVAIREDGSYPEYAENDNANEDSYPERNELPDDATDDVDLLEMEALAEMEMIKLKIELERKRRENPHGLSGTDKQKINYLKTLAKKIDRSAFWDFK